MTTINDGGPAFPMMCADGLVVAPGVSKRELMAMHFAPMFYQTLHARLQATESRVENIYQIVSLAAYEMADEMLNPTPRPERPEDEEVGELRWTETERGEFRSLHYRIAYARDPKLWVAWDQLQDVVILRGNLVECKIACTKHCRAMMEGRAR